MLQLKFLIFIFVIVFKTTNGGNSSCTPDMFSCLSGECIKYSQTCDLTRDCADGSDEENCGSTCPDGWFHCNNGNCILLRWKCDGENDCGDGSEEQNCGRISEQCSHGEFRCHDNKKCIALSWVCDGHNDCSDASDESPGCIREGPCEGFLCKNKRECLPRRWRCDGMIDCKDASDESNCTGPADVPCLEEELKFFCDDRSACIDHDLVCNSVRNCNDGSDEGGQCDTKSCKNAGCSHNCFQTPKRALCYCPSGYSLAPNTSHCIDVDECLNKSNPVCSHNCLNTRGSFACSCHSGYKLKANENGGVNHECIVEDPEPILVYSASTELKVIKLRSGLVYPLHENLNHAVGVDYDSSEDKIYWTEIAAGSEAIKSSKLDGSNVAFVVTTGIAVVEDVAVDWVAHNIYFTDSGFMRLVVCTNDGSFCKVLINDIRQPRALIVHPPNGRMYWSDWSHTPLIEYAEMDGSNRKILVSKELGWPNGLAIDHALNRLYWIDAKLERIEYITLNEPHERHLVFEQMMLHPFAFAVFEDTFYWTDWSRHTLESCNKFTGADHKVLVKESRESIPMGIHVYHPLTQEAMNSPCWAHDCQQLCLIKAGHKHTCECADGYQLSSDKKSCVGLDSKRILLSVEDTFYEFLDSDLGRSMLKPLEIKAKMVIGAVAYNPLSNTIIYSDLGSKEIIAVDMKTRIHSVIVSTHLEAVECLAVDWNSGNLYWADVSLKTLEVINMEKRHRKVLIKEKLDHPMDVALVPHKGYMFISISAKRSRIEKMDMDGSQRHIFIDFDVNSPMSMAVDYEKELLYWVDVASGKIEWTTLDGKNRFAMNKYVGRPRNVAVAKDMVAWTDITNGLQLWLYHERSALLKTIHLQSEFPLAKITSMTHLLIVDSVPNLGTNACLGNNGGCSHLCLPTESSYVCACPTGLFLAHDQKTCESKRECSADEFKCSNSYCIPLSMTCDRFSDCPDGQDEINCRPMCDQDEFQCGNHECIPQRWVCDHSSQCLDGSDELDCPVATCGPRTFSCQSDGACVSMRWRCDGHPDCHDKSDEQDCQNVNCPNSYFQCHSGQCLPGSWHCDGEIDCRDASDEENCQPSAHQCKPLEFSCANGKCLDKELLCDHDDDCGDNSDEKQCGFFAIENIIQCPGDKYKCTDTNRCIDMETLCDGFNDCLNGEDEKNCTKRGCQNGEFSCINETHCIPMAWTCDGENDCLDASDETLPQCHKRINSDHSSSLFMPIIAGLGRAFNKGFSSNHSEGGKQPIDVCKDMDYRCTNGQCISIHNVCDRKNDCDDLSDEGDFCSTACDVVHDTCSDLCVPSPSGPICKCRNGYKLEMDQKTCFDVNECLYLGVCSQRCQNTEGSYVCSCLEGYELRSNHRSCKAKGPSPKLLLAFPNKIISHDFFTDHVEMITHSELAFITDLDFDYVNEEIYWVDANGGTVNKHSLKTKSESILIGHLNSPKVMAVDWISRLLVFWEDSGNGSIYVCTLDGKDCADAIHIGRRTINNIVIDAREGLMYWSLLSSTIDHSDGVIERAYMNGKNRNMMATSKIADPVGLTLDHPQNHLYWIDARLRTIETLDIVTKYRRVIVHSDHYYPMAMAAYEDDLYWADWGANTVYYCDKFSCGPYPTPFLEHVIKVHDMAFYQPVQQPNGTNQCISDNVSQTKCSHICIPSSVAHACLCPRGMIFSDILNTTCIKDPNQLPDIVKTNKCKDKKLCFNGGRCYMNSENMESCECLSSFVGLRCETKISQESNIMNVTKNKELDGGGNNGWIAGVIVALLSIAAAGLAIAFYFRRFGPPRFRSAFAPIPLINPTFGPGGESNEESDYDHRYVPADESYKSYTNPMYHGDMHVNIEINGNDSSKVKFHVVDSSASLDSDFNSESSSTLIDYTDKNYR